MDKNNFINCLLGAYGLGSDACKQVNFGRKEFPAYMKKNHRIVLNKMLKQFGFPLLTDEEYEKFCH